MAESIRKIDVNGDLRNIEDSRLICNEVGATIEIPVFGSAAFKVKQPNEDVSISIRPGVYIGENFYASDGYITTSNLSSAAITIGTRSRTVNPRVSIGQHVDIGDNVKIDSNIRITKDSLSGMTDVEWTSESDMNNFRTKGSYYIHGIKTKADDRLPINTVNSGASFAAHLTVVDGSLQPSDGSTPTEICVTQFLMLSNRLGMDGNMYFRTYNEPKNVEAGKGIWTDWKRMVGSVEGYIFSNTKKMNVDFGYQDKEVGLNYMVDNGTYQGVYINDEALTYQEGSYNAETGNGVASLDPTKIAYVETFIITTINDYAATAQVNQMLGSLGLPQKTRQICQFKQATNVLTGTSSYQKRTCLGNGEEYKTASNWSEWEEIGGSGSGSSEVDITSLVGDFTLKQVLLSGLLQTGVTYKINHYFKSKIDFEKINTHLATVSADSDYNVTLKILEFNEDNNIDFKLTCDHASFSVEYYAQWYPQDNSPSHFSYSNLTKAL